MDKEIQEAVQTVIENQKQFNLPRKALEIPRNCLMYPRPIVIWTRTDDFLKMLDGEVRKNPHEGVSLADAAKMMKSLGGTASAEGVRELLSRTVPLHVLTVYKKRVRLSRRELLELVEADWKRQKTA